MSTLPAPLRGIIPPLVTPLRDRDHLDVPALERLVEHVLAAGVHGIFVLGTTGEFAGLTEQVKREVISEACRAVAGRVPVLAGVTHTAASETLALAEHAAQAGATALVLSTPYYFPLSQPELLAYFERLVPRLPLPVYLYSIPSCTKVKVELEVLAAVLEWPQVAGFKDSSGDLGLFHQAMRLLATHPGKSFLAGPEALMAETVLLGGHGGICGGANLLPRLYVELYEAAAAGDLARVRPLQTRVARLVGTLYNVNPHPSSYLRSLKCALSLLGLCDDLPAEPLDRFDAADRAKVAECLHALGIG